MDDEASRRGAGFPVVALLDAARVLNTVGRYGAEHSEAAFATYLGHSTANSGPFRTKLAAFRDWRLISRKTGRVEMTDLGRRLAMSADPAQEVDALRDAFEACAIFVRLYDEAAKGVPLTYDTLARTAVFNLGVSPKSQQRFVEVFVASAEAARLAERVDDRSVRLLGRDEFMAPVPSDTVGRRGEATPPVTPQDGNLVETSSTARLLAGAESATPALPRTDAPVVLRQVWPHASGSLVFEVRSRVPLPPAAFGAIAAVAESAAALVTELNGGIDG